MPEFDELLRGEADQRRAPRRSGALRDHVAPELAGWHGESLKGVATADTVLSMQRLAGNAAVVQLLAQSGEEVEAEGVGSSGRSPVLDVVGRGGGEPLDEPTRASMEQALGADLADVRVHHDAAAGASAKAVDAHAYTVGSEVVFQPDLYKPATPEGRRMLAHELTHVVQQRSGPVDGTATGDGIAVSDPDDRFERAAEANADRVMAETSHTQPGGLEIASGPLAAAAGVQRDAAEDEEEAGQELAQQGEELMEQGEQLEEEAEETG